MIRDAIDSQNGAQSRDIAPSPFGDPGEKDESSEEQELTGIEQHPTDLWQAMSVRQMDHVLTFFTGRWTRQCQQEAAVDLSCCVRSRIVPHAFCKELRLTIYKGAVEQTQRLERCD